jgi:cellulose synthase/poly-beta-1,6-N-acetylglucosamine synthase-like glycosyltransferase
MTDVHIWIETVFQLSLSATLVLSCGYLMLTLLALFIRRRPDAPAADISRNDCLPPVTIQIPTYNETAALHCARRCLQFDYPAEKLQILIGDDSSDDAVSAQLDAFAAQHPRITVCRRGGNAGFKPGNLNHMLKQTTGDYILILDSDFLPDPSFLRHLVQPVIHDPSLAGVQAAWHITNTHQNLTTLMGSGIINVIHVVILPLLRRFAQTGIFCGSAELIRRDLLEDSGGWTPGALTEDVDFSLRVLNAGERIAYLETLCCACEVPHRTRDLFRQQMRWAYGVMRAFMNHGRTLLISRLAHGRTKLAAVCFAGGYIMITLFIITSFFGLLNLAGGWVDPAPAGTGPVWQILSGTALNVLLTCGMLVSSLCASFIAGAGVRSLGKLAVASLTLGIVLILFVGKGLFKALFGLPMQWFMVRKNGNLSATTQA